MTLYLPFCMPDQLKRLKAGVAPLGLAAAAPWLFAGPAMAAGTCDNAAPPYELPSQPSGVYLDDDCSGTSGIAVVTGDLPWILDEDGNEQSWTVSVNPGVTVDANSGLASVELQSPGGTVDNSGTIAQSGTGNVILFNDAGASAGAGTVYNRDGGVISNSATGSTISFQAGGWFYNNSGATLETTTGSGVNVTNAGIYVENDGVIDVPYNNAISANSGATIVNNGTINGRINGIGSGNVIIYNNGILTGSQSDLAIRSTTSGSLVVVNSGQIYAGSSFTTAIRSTDSSADDRLVLTPGDTPGTGGTVIGIVDMGGGTDTLRFAGGGTGTWLFDLDKIDTGSGTQSYRDFEVFEVTGGAWNFLNGTTAAFDVYGGTVKGNGTFGALTVNSGGTIAPGNSIGTISVTDLTYNAGSTYEVELNDGGAVPGINNDLLDVSNDVILNGGTVHVMPENGTDDGTTYTPGEVYTIITAGGTVTGTFTTLIDDYSFLNFSLGYTGNSVTLTSALTDLCLAGFSDNQCATADALETLGAGTLFTAVTNLTGGEAEAMDALSGEIHASAQSALVEDSRFIREAALARLQTATKDPHNGATGLWGHVFGASGNWDGDGNAAAMHRSIGGLLFGADGSVTDTITAGVFGGYGRSDISVNDRASSGSADSWHLGAYAGGNWDGFSLGGGAAYDWHTIETDRSVSFPGFSDSLSAAYDAGTAQVFAEASYRFEAGSAGFEPYAGVAHIHLSSDGFSESGGEAALTGAGSDMDTTFTTIGARADAVLPLGETTARLNGGIGWRHASGDIAPDAQMAFSGSDSFTISGIPIARDALLLDLGVEMAFSPSATLSVSYSGQFGSSVSEHAGKASLEMAF